MRRTFLALVALGALACGCGGTSTSPASPDVPSPEVAARTVDPRAGWSPRARYAADLRASAPEVADLWMVAAERMLAAPLPTDMPLREHVDWASHGTSYAISLNAGRRLVVTLDEAFGGFTELFFQPITETGVVSAARRVASSEGPLLEYGVDKGGRYVLRVQPKASAEGLGTIALTTEPRLGFPVAGKHASAIQSFFGAPRDRGRRAHHGVDVFAPYGTPVVAAGDGTVMRVGTHRLGGNVVWIREDETGAFLYYAHLSAMTVRSGASVTRGDVVGAVGTSGNARYGAPHLHFGIYGARGPIDPLPFVDDRSGKLTEVHAPSVDALGQPRKLRTRTRLAQHPSGKASVRDLAKDTEVWPVAARGRWVRVRLADGEMGWVRPQSLVHDGQHGERGPFPLPALDPAPTISDS